MSAQFVKECLTICQTLKFTKGFMKVRCLIHAHIVVNNLLQEEI